MTQTSSTDGEPSEDDPDGPASELLSGAGYLVFALVSFILAFSQPVLAAETAGSSLLCNGSTATGLGKVMNFFMKSTFSVGCVGAVAMWQFQNVVEIITFSRERLKQAKQQKQRIGMSVLGLLGIGPVAKYGGQAMGITFASCIDFTPFI